MFARHARCALLTMVVGFAATGCSNTADSAKTDGAAAPSATASADYKRDVPNALAAKATVTEARAAAIALALVPGGRIESVELEEEDGKLLYSYDIRVEGKSGIEEIHVDAMTGAVLRNEHETPEDEKAEAAEDDDEPTAPPTNEPVGA